MTANNYNAHKNKKTSGNKKPGKPNKNNMFSRRMIIIAILLLCVLYLANWPSGSQQTSLFGVTEKLSYGQFYKMLEENPGNPTIKSAYKTEDIIEGELIDGRRFSVHVPDGDEELIPLLRKNIEGFEIRPPGALWTALLYLAPWILILAFFWYFSYRGTQMGNKIWSFGKIKSRPPEDANAKRATFADVAGIEEAKEELQEVIEFLKDPKRFQRLGGKIPKGVLLVGPPGCGKTLLAKAVAGEAGVPFFSMSGSDFVEMFVGVGASRVRDLFEQGRKAAKLSGKGCIVFIDEIDAVGRQRFAGIGGGHDEREQTLNQLLGEMDGFDTTEGLIIVAATNRPDTPDPALLRPGRFDRHIVVNLPDILGREAILKVHTRKIKLSDDVDFKIIAKQTAGFSGADLANLCNESALLAARFNKESVSMKEMESTIERVLMGPEKKSRIISKREKSIVAFHESGHAMLSLLIPEADPLRKVSIIPRGLAGGYTIMPQQEDRHYWTKNELIARLTVALGGRVSEQMNMGEITTGAENDLRQATELARRMACEFGMSEKIGHMTLGKHHGPLFLGRDIMEERDYSEETAKLIDEEVKKIIYQAHERAKNILESNKDKLTLLANALLEKEVLGVDEVRKLTGIPAPEDKESAEKTTVSQKTDGA